MSTIVLDAGKVNSYVLPSLSKSENTMYQAYSTSQLLRNSLPNSFNGRGMVNEITTQIYNLKKEINLFKVLVGLSGTKATFEPVCYFSIYRNITLVGGYTKFHKLYKDADSAYWHYVCSVEQMTKEVIPYHMRLALLDKTRQMYRNIAEDNRFKIFLLVDGKINSVWEREDA